MKKIVLDKPNRLYLVLKNDKEIDFSSSLSVLRKKGFSEKDYPFEK